MNLGELGWVPSRLVWSGLFSCRLVSSLLCPFRVQRSRGLHCRGHVDSISPFNRLGNKTLASIIYSHYRYFTPTRTCHVFMVKLFSIISRVRVTQKIRPDDRRIIRGLFENGGKKEKGKQLRPFVQAPRARNGFLPDFAKFRIPAAGRAGRGVEKNRGRSTTKEVGGKRRGFVPTRIRWR